jgi:hypothetical protein
VGIRDAGGYVAGAAPGAVRGARVQKEPGATCAPAFYGSASAHRTAGLRVAVFVAEPAPVLQARNSAVGQKWDGGISVWMETHSRQSVAGSAISRHHSFVRCAGQHRSLAPRSLCILFYVSDRQGSFTTIVPWRNLQRRFNLCRASLCVFPLCVFILFPSLRCELHMSGARTG